MIEITDVPFYRTARTRLGGSRLGSNGLRLTAESLPLKPIGSDAVLSEQPQCLVIDGHPLVRLGVRNALAEDFSVHEVASRTEGLELVRDIGSFDVAIVDMRAEPLVPDQGIDGREAIRALRKAEPGLGVVAHGERPDRHCASTALQAGAAAYVSRTSGPKELWQAAQAALAHESFVDPAVPPPGSRGRLTRRQREILQLLANGESTTVAARQLDLSEETVKTHMKHALARLGARNRTHAVAIALRESLIE